MKKTMKYENLAVIVKYYGGFKVLTSVSGDSKAEVIRKVKKTNITTLEIMV